ncbi:EF-P beta-lysylation protein EpmB [Moraxella sp. Tifton1]|uniref:EF-P beta-lysylation protein EpmB n=1 Tax=Moraxella oculi TaxID=2940516 RepID=UPI002010E891|nr:EF-P beta-lysylation protein EpmB [Moraxella sp. Tifton1]MCL1623052.1 EF-P beta-lysylation protein EpmB [Moraxella sp. Tifton1]
MHNPSKISTKISLQAPSGDSWQEELADGLSDVRQLCEYLGLDLSPHHEPKSFKLKVPKAFADKMKKGDVNDPLLLQVLPDIQETMVTAGYTHDPLIENAQNPIKGLLHKYKNRVLITTTGACAVHCRYCFRQHFDYQSNMPNTQQIAKIAEYVASHTEVDEVILSGGDPLSLSHRRLSMWFDAISAMSNIKTVRIHTRLPVVLPNRVDDQLIQLLSNCPKNIIMVLHINHANEIDEHLRHKCQQLRRIGVTLLNQTVLLKTINDDVDTLCQLSRALFTAGILPYYLHVLDKVQGAAHFDLPIARAIQIYWGMLENLSGYLVPKLVQELPNQPYKTPVNLYQ